VIVVSFSVDFMFWDCVATAVHVILWLHVNIISYVVLPLTRLLNIISYVVLPLTRLCFPQHYLVCLLTRLHKNYSTEFQKIQWKVMTREPQKKRLDLVVIQITLCLDSVGLG